jgi:hypothetical protein
MRPRTIEVKADTCEFAKARELIEIRGTDTLTLQDRRIINILYANSGGKLCDDIQHVISIDELRGIIRAESGKGFNTALNEDHR